MAELTPMKKQYNEIKQQHPDCLLFFRLGDFYEMFDDDAKLASRELDLALTTRDRNVEDPELRTPMCGVPYHSAETYIARLIAKGYKVAICEQMEDPALSSMLEEKRSNYICAVELSGDKGGIAFCDVSTGEFCCAAFEKDAVSHILNELGRFAPREALLSHAALEERAVGEFLRQKLGAMLELPRDYFEYMPAAAALCERFGYRSVDEAGLEERPEAVSAVGALLRYIRETQKFDLDHIRRLDVFRGGRYMEMDWTTRRSLELTESLRSGEKRGSLLWVLDKTKTPMGARLLRAWVERPLLSVLAIKRRHAAVGELTRESVKRSELSFCSLSSARSCARSARWTCWRICAICWTGPFATIPPSRCGRAVSCGKATPKSWTASVPCGTTEPTPLPPWRPGSGSAPASRS